jgi:hypothetical protein
LRQALYIDAYRKVVDFLRAAREPQASRATLWTSFHAGLSSLSVGKDVEQTIELWALENLDRHQPEFVRQRVLHDIEQRFVTTEAYGRLLEAQFQGMLSPNQIELIFDDLASRELSPVGPEHVNKLIVKVWSRNLAGIRTMKVN